MKLSKSIGVGSALLLLCACVASSQPQPPARAGRGAQGTRAVSPEISPDNRVTFRLRAPKAAEVLVNGDWPGGRGLR